MSTLIKAIEKKGNKTTTTNGAKAVKSTLDANLDLFYKIGASRGRDITGDFWAAMSEDEDKAIRIALWARDIRGGAGERQAYRSILKSLAHARHDIAVKLIAKTVEVGRWDDLLVLEGTAAEPEAFAAIKTALDAGDALCAKWMPRKGEVAAKLRKSFGWTPKFYRKTLVGLTQVVESQMCAGKWGEIEYSKLPSVASARYQKAFGRQDQTRYVEYLQALERGDKGVKINASAVYPYDIVKSVRYGNAAMADQQWKALPDYVEDGNFLCMVDVSGSMGVAAGGNPAISCMDVAISLGLYCAERCKGIFKDVFLTFSERPTLVKLSGPLSNRVNTMRLADWGMNTNIISAFDLMLDSAVSNKVSADEMPQSVIILSDMQFDMCTKGFSTLKDIKKRYKAAGYELPQLIFWNLNAKGNAPTTYNKEGVALVSGFSPSLMNSVIGGKFQTPAETMDKIVMVDRYNWQ